MMTFMMFCVAIFVIVTILWEGRKRRRAEDALGSLADTVRRFEHEQLGGTPELAIEVESPSVVEARAASFVCMGCQGPVLVEQHEVETHGDERLRVARVACKRCGRGRSIYFRLAPNR